MMSALMIALTLAAAPATSESEAPPSPLQVRQSVERSLVFLEKSGLDWWNKSKCASCHHVPMSVWSLSEAKNRGFAVNDESLDQLRNWALASYVNHPKLRPVGQDGEEKGSSASLNTIYLTQAAISAIELDEPTTDALKKFTVHLLDAQDPDGSWKSSATLPPVGDITEVRTMQVLLALSTAHERGLIDAARWTSSRDRALAWLRNNKKFIDQNQSLNLQVLVAQRFGKPEELQPLVKQLIEQQEADGGWSQTKERPSGDLKEYEEKKPAPATETKDVSSEHLNKNSEAKQPPAEIKVRPSDALATGQTLFALTMAGVDSQQPAIQRAQAFLLRTQTADGSWLVPFRSQKNSGRALTHYGTGWAAIGLMQTLSTPVGKAETTKLSATAASKEQ
jgi:hypothetical protein